MTTARTVHELIRLSTQYLGQRGCESPRLDAELLIGFVLGIDRVQVYLNLDRPLTPPEVDAYRQLVAKRGRRIPVAYLVGHKEFFAFDFRVDEHVLIPRPETEILVDSVLKLSETYAAPRLLDIGTGSGSVAVTVARMVEQSEVVAVDISPEAIALAAANAAKASVSDRVRFCVSDLCNGLSQQRFSIICSNPPYIPSGEWSRLPPEVRAEPRLALDGGHDGLEFYRRILDQTPPFLEKGGYVVLEIGCTQSSPLAKLAAERGFALREVLPDYGGRDRVVVLQWP